MSSIELSVIHRDGTKKSFSKPAGQGEPPVDIKTLQKSLLSLQQESNSYLTQLVEQERDRAQTTENGKQTLDQNPNGDDDSEDDEDDDDEEEKVNDEPVKKKQKR